MFRVLVATDGSSYANKALDYACSLTRMIEGAEITVLSVVDTGSVSVSALSSSEAPFIPLAGLGEELEKASQVALEEAKVRLAPCSNKVETHLGRGRPADVICKTAEKENFDLIVLGNSGLGHISGMILGSVSDRVVHQSKVPVLIVPSRRR